MFSPIPGDIPLKILKICGRNLASLEHFEVDFEAEPLRSAGLFAITGPTGSGKSTLLDALCLALYDQTPRLCGGGGSDIPDSSGNPVKSQDVLSLVRRGAVEAFVEVVFVGNDQAAYKARWEVHRKGKKASGKIIDQRLSLVRVSDSQLLGGKKGETLAEIKAQIGLSFEQFVQAVILPQGEFAAFLKAPEKARADLLERMTGTGLYSEISRQAHQEAAWWKRRIAETEQDVERIPVLEPPGRLSLEAQLQERRENTSTLAAELTTAQLEVHWHGTHRQLQAQEQEAVNLLSQAEQALEHAAPEAQELQAIDAAQSARSAWDAEAAARGRIVSAQSARDLAAAALLQCSAHAQQTSQLLTAAREQVERAQVVQETLKPDLDLARRLDVDLTHARQQLETQHQATQKHQEEAGQANRSHQQLQQALTETQQALTREQDWQLEHAVDAQIEPAWVEWKPALEGWRDAERALSHLQQQLPGLEHAQQTAHTRLEQARQRLEQSAAQVEGRRQALTQAEALLDEVDHRALAQARQQNDATRSLLQRLTAAAQKARDLLQDQDSARTQATQAEASLLQAQTELAALETELLMTRSRLDEATQARDRLKLSLNLNAQRTQLREGQPCPLCGATSHPYAGTALENPFRDAEARVTTLHAAVKQLELRQQDLRSKGDQAQTTLKLQTELIEKAQASLEAQRQTWQQQAEALAVLQLEGDPAHPEVEDRLERLQQATLEEAEQLRARDTQLEGLRTASAQARRALNACQEAHTQEEQALRIAEAGALEAAGALQKRQEDRARQLEARQRHQRTLEPAFQTFPSLVHAAEQNPETLLKALEARRQRWSESATRLNARTMALKEQQVQAVGLEQRCIEASERLESSLATQTQAEQQLQQLQLRRATLLDGRQVLEVEAALKRTLEQAQGARDTAERDHSAAQQALSAASSRDQHSAETLEQEARAAEEAARQLEAHLQALQVTPDRLAALLQVSQSARQMRKARLEAQRQARDRAAATFSTLRSQREDLEKTRPASDPQQADAHVETLQAQHRQVLQETGRLEEQLRQDDQNRERRARFGERLEQVRAEAKVWLDLDELIGSASGDTFRRLAQTLSLERLVTAANVHLCDLAPRYVLSRIGAAGGAVQTSSTGLDLMVVDRDMGDEARSINTLSGGESFLVSLALALGLASLASQAIRIESLFIDEGFGSLDPETLEQALSVLDGLQASGRKVGVISHVPGLTERLAVQVRVEPLGQGRSRVRVEGR